MPRLWINDNVKGEKNEFLKDSLVLPIRKQGEIGHRSARARAIAGKLCRSVRETGV